MELGGLECLGARELGQDRRQSSCEHGLAGPRRADQQEVVASRRRDLECAPRPRLASDLGQVPVRRRRLRPTEAFDRRRLPCVS